MTDDTVAWLAAAVELVNSAGTPDGLVGHDWVDRWFQDREYRSSLATVTSTGTSTPSAMLRRRSSAS